MPHRFDISFTYGFLLLLTLFCFFQSSAAKNPLEVLFPVSEKNGQKHIYLTANSNCSAAFPISRVPSKELGELRSVFNFGRVEKSAEALKLVNAGTGTTGTKEIYHFCSEFGASCHWGMCAPNTYTRTYRSWLKHFESLRDCIHYKQSAKICETKYWLEKLKDDIQNVVVEKIQALHDIPNNFFIREYIDLVPDLVVLHSVRDPKTWVLKRVGDHPLSDLMCDMHVKSNRNISSPFHILDCLDSAKTTYIHESMTYMGRYMGMTSEEAHQYIADPSLMPAAAKAVVEEVAGYYADYAQRLMNTVATRVKYYRAICVWDENFP